MLLPPVALAPSLARTGHANDEEPEPPLPPLPLPPLPLPLPTSAGSHGGNATPRNQLPGAAVAATRASCEEALYWKIRDPDPVPGCPSASSAYSCRCSPT